LRKRDFLLLYSIPATLEAHMAFYSLGTREYFPESKGPSILSSPEEQDLLLFGNKGILSRK
jgi:hypothetical protein